MKTIARPAPTFAPKAGQPGPGSPVGTRPPVASSGVSRPAPGLPSKLTLPRAGAPLSGASSPPSQAPFSPQPAARAPTAASPKTAESDSDLESTDEREFPSELGAGRSASQAIEIGDDGMADAEAALEAMQSFRSAEAALQRNDLANAERLAQKALEGDPTQADYLTLLAGVRSLGGHAGAVGEAITTMSNVLREDPSNERALLYRGKLFARSNRLQEALADFNELLAGNPQNRDAQAELRAVQSKIA